MNDLVPPNGNCGVCETELDQQRSFPQCRLCSRTFHFKCLSSGPAIRTWSTSDNQAKDLWECEFCITPNEENNTAGGTPQASKRKRSLTSPLDSNSLKRPSVLEEMGTLTLESIKELMESQHEKLKKDLVEEIQGKIQESFRNEFAEIRKETVELNEKIEVLERENHALKSRCDLLEKNAEETEQYSKSYNLIISGVPVKPQEDLKEVVKEIADKCTVLIKDWDIIAVHRLQPRQSGDVPIIVKFHSKKKKEEIIVNSKNKGLTAELFGGKKDVKLFFNEHLTSQKNFLFKQARELKNDKYNYKFVWVRNGQIMVRKKEGDRIEFIKKVQDLTNIKNQYGENA